MKQIQELLNRYYEWVRCPSVRPVSDGWTEVTTQYVDRHGDHVQVYVRRDGDRYRMRDDGFSGLGSLKVDADPPWNGIVAETLRGFGIRQTADGGLEVEATAEDFAARLHGLIQSILAMDAYATVALRHEQSQDDEEIGRSV